MPVVSSSGTLVFGISTNTFSLNVPGKSFKKTISSYVREQGKYDMSCADCITDLE